MARGGLSLVELVLAVTIVGLACVPVVQVLLSSGSSIRQTQPYTQALFFGELCAEEARLASEEDPYAVDRLIGEAYGASRAPIARGGHPFLTVLEDSATPFGSMEPGRDLSLEPAAGTLFKLAEPLGLQIHAALDTSDPSGPPEARVEARIDWVDQRGVAMVYKVVTPVKVWTPRQTIDPPVIWLPQPGSAKRQAFLELLVLGDRAQEIVKSVEEAAKTTQTGLQTGYEGAVIGTQLGAAQEAGAGELLGLLQMMKAPVEELASGVPPGSLGTPPPAADRLAAAVQGVRFSIEAFFQRLTDTIKTTSRVAQMTPIPASLQLTNHLRLIRAAKMDCLARPWASMAPLDQLLNDLTGFYERRMPNPAHFFTVERSRLSDLTANFALMDAIRDLQVVRLKFDAASKNTLAYSSGGQP